MSVKLNQLYQHYLNSSGISTDTRTIRKGKLFFALKGPHFNANKLAALALEKGAALAVVDDPDYAANDRCFLVADALKTLQDLALHHRRQLNIPFIGITGSNGKTSTKELVRDVLATQYRVLATKGNLNNHIGVPLTLLSIGPEVEVAIIEMGANAVGEIAFLCALAEPTHGLITNIGKAHLEGFGGIEGVIRGKSELYNYLIQTGGIIFVNTRQEILKNMAEKRIKNPYLYPGESDYFHARLISAKPVVTYETEKGERVTTQIHGEYNFDNICTALCIGKYFEVEAAKANEAVKAYVSENNRSQKIKKDDKTIILDAYNANPSSMAAALRNLKAVAEGHKSAILGDMFELGEEAAKEHAALGELTRTLGIDLPIFCGELMEAAAIAHPQSIYLKTKEELSLFLEENVIPPGHLLIKGSRGMGLETILDKIK